MEAELAIKENYPIFEIKRLTPERAFTIINDWKKNINKSKYSYEDVKDHQRTQLLDHIQLKKYTIKEVLK